MHLSVLSFRHCIISIKLLKATPSIICVFAVVLGRRVPRKHPPVHNIAFLLGLPSLAPVAVWGAGCC